MQTVPVQLNVPKAEKDLIDVVVGMVKDLKDKKGIVTIAGDAAKGLLKLAGEYSELAEEVKTLDASDFDAVLYLEQQLMGVFLPQAQASDDASGSESVASASSENQSGAV